MFRITISLQGQKKFSKLFLSFLLLQTIFLFIATGQPLSNYTCYAIATNNSETDSLFKFLPEYDVWVNIGALENVNVKAMAVNPYDEILYATSGPIFGTINPENTTFNSINLIGPATKGDYGPVFIQDIVGLAYDIYEKRLFALNRITNQIGNGRPDSPDIILELDCITGRVVENAFEDSYGNPADYAALGEVEDGTLQDFVFDAKDLAFDPYTQELIVAQDQDSPTYLTSVNKLNGNISEVIMEVPESDVTGLAFTSEERLLATTLYNPAYNSQGKLIEIIRDIGFTRDLGYIDESLKNYAFHCLDCFIIKPGCYNTLSLSNINCNRRKYNVKGNIEVEVFFEGDTLNLTSASEILLKNNFEVLQTSNFCAKIDTTICQ